MIYARCAVVVTPANDDALLQKIPPGAFLREKKHYDA